jgi:hypothetical protein
MHSDEILIIGNTEESIQNWASRSFISPELREQLLAVDFLLVPEESYLKTASPHFPEGTEEFFQFLRIASNGKLSFDICIEEEDYQELVLHHDLLTIASVFTFSFAAPLAVNLIAEFIKRRVGKRLEEIRVKSSLTIQDQSSGRIIKFKYDGPASLYEDALLNALKVPTETIKLPITKSKDINLVSKKQIPSKNHGNKRNSKLSK